MINSTDLLGRLLQGALKGPAMGRMGHAMGQNGIGAQTGMLGQILGRLTGSGRPVGAGGDVLGSLAGLATRGLAGGGRGAMLGSLGALAASVLSGRGRGSGGVVGRASRDSDGSMRGAVGAGGLALLGMLAVKALRGASQQPAAAPSGEFGSSQAMPAAPAQATSDGTALLVLKAMVAAAAADGQIDADERQRITSKLHESGADPAAIRFIEQEIERPTQPEMLAAEARDPVVAAQLYAASLLAIKVDTAGEQSYLRRLATQLGLEPGTVAHLHQALGVAAT